MEEKKNISLYIIHSLESHNRTCAIQSEDTQLSGKQLINKILNIGQYLRNQGVRAEDVVSTRIASPIDNLASSLAIALIGATVLIRPTTTPQEKLWEWDRRVKTKWLLHDLDNIGAEKEKHKCINLKDLPEQVTINAELIAIKKPEAPWLIATGSGSTGKPKLMPISHLQQIERCKLFKTWAPYTSEDIFASLVAFNFSTGTSRILECFAIGAKARLMEFNSKASLANLYEVTCIYGTPFHVRQLLKIKKTYPNLLPKLISSIIAGDLVSKELRREAQKKLCKDIYVIYGCNETGSCCIAKPPSVYNDSELLGNLIEGYSVEIVDENENQLPRNKIGQIRIKSKCNISHYIDDEEKNKQTFRKGYMYPGDFGLIDDYGHIYFKGRTDGMMIFNGINIYPLEIQKCLLSHSNINDIAITSIKHETHGDLPIAIVELVNPAVETSEKDLHEFISERLGNYYVHKFIITKILPRDERGKLTKENIKKLLDSAFANNNQSNTTILSIYKEIFDKQLKEGRLILKIPECSETEVRHSAQLINSILGISLKEQENSSSTDSTIKMTRMACELTNIIFQAANIPTCIQPAFISLGEAKDQNRIYLLHFYQFINGLEQLFLKTMREIHFTLYSLRNAKISKQQSLKIAEVINTQIEALHRQTKKHYYGKSSASLAKYASTNNIPMLYRSYGWIQYGWGRQSISMIRSSISGDSAIGARASQNKFITSQLLKELGFPIPHHRLATNRESASIIAKSINEWPIVVKPNDADRGEGVTTGIKNETELLKAYDYAAKSSKNKEVLIENTIPGTCHRIFIANGNLIYCVKRRPNGVYGNGKDSIKQLIKKRQQSSQIINLGISYDVKLSLDHVAINTLQESGLNEDSIPELNAFIPLRPIETTAWGGIDEDCTDHIHDDNVQLAIDICNSFYLSICGVDIISNDISVPWYENGAKINEINYAPLVGGGEASLKSLPKLMGSLMKNNGIIPINIFVGAENSEREANLLYEHLINSQASDSYLITKSMIKGPGPKIIQRDSSSLYDNLFRCLAKRNCSAIVITIDDDDILWTGLPINQCKSVKICDTKLFSSTSPGDFASNSSYKIITKELLSLQNNQLN